VSIWCLPINNSQERGNISQGDWFFIAVSKLSFGHWVRFGNRLFTRTPKWQEMSWPWYWTQETADTLCRHTNTCTATGEEHLLFICKARQLPRTHTLSLQDSLRSKTKPAVAAWLAFFWVSLHVTKTRTRCFRNSRILKIHTHTRTRTRYFFLANNK